MVHTSRILLVEFATVDRFHCAMMFPYLQGAALNAGLEVRWIRFGVKAASRLKQAGPGAPLPEEDLEALGAAVEDFGPSRILFGHQPAPKVIAAVRDSGTTVDCAFLADSSELSGDDACPGLGERSCLTWLGLDATGGPLADRVDPNFGWIPGNELAQQARPLPFLLCGPECRYSRRVADNPAFDGVDLEGCVNTDGCAFCRTTRGGGRWASAPLDLARRNLEAVRDTHPPWPGRPRYRLTGEQLFAQVDKLAALVLELGLEPGDLLLDSRADRIEKFAPRLRQAAASLAGSGHTLQICLVGLENFSPPELRRMNKGLTAATLARAVDLLQQLEADHPESFGLREYGGFSTILYTPWTTLEDLALNLQMVALFELSPLCGKLLSSRLRLYNDLPLARLARRDGLLTEALTDPALDTARRNFYPDELPWRFANPEVELVNRVTTRLEIDRALEEDELYARVGRWFRSLPGGTSRVQAARHLVTVLRADPSISSVDALMEAASRDACGEERPLHLMVGTESMVSEEVLLLRKWTPSAAMIRLGRKPVRKEEPLSLKQVEALQALVPHERLPNITFRRRLRTRDEQAVYEMFCGEDPELVRETSEVTGKLEDPQKYLDSKPELIARIGVLLGYPSCCSEAFSRVSLTGWARNEWVHLQHRGREPGPLPPEMNPFQYLFFVPCSPSCEVALELVQAIRVDRLASLESGAKQANEQQARMPVLFLLNRPGQFVVLSPEEPPQAGRMRYTAERCNGDDPRLELVGRGDTLILDGGLITVLSGGQVLHTFALEAAVWWHERAFHAEFWEPVVARMLRDRDVTSEEEGRATATPEVDPMERLTGEFTEWLEPDELALAAELAWRVGGDAAASPAVEVKAFPSPAGLRVTRMALGQGAERFVLSLAGRRLEMGGQQGVVHHDIFCQPTDAEPPGGRQLKRLLGVLLDARARHQLRGAEAGQGAKFAAGSPLLRRVERASMALTGSARRGDFMTSWPVQAPDGTVLLTLTDGGARWLDLYLDELHDLDAACFMATGETAISHFPYGHPWEAPVQRALERLKRALSRVESV